MMGFSPKDINKSSSNYTTKGYYFYLNGGTLYSQKGDSCRSFYSNSSSNNDVYGAVYDKKKGTITFYKSGASIGVAFTDLKKLDLYPAFDFYDFGSTAELIKGKYKKK